MATAETASTALHLLVGALWAGGVVFFAWAVLPGARDGATTPEALSAATGRLKTLSRASAVLLLLTGGHLAGAGYTADSLLGTTAGNLVLAMILLWLVLAALVEVGASRLSEGLEADKLREPARDASTLFRAAAVVALLVLLDAGLLAGGL